jgi:protein-S-isoprenylcysteine O-methyltransferase Ste14
MTAEPGGRGPNVPFPPPLIFAASFFAAWLLDRYVVHLWPSMPAGIAAGARVIGWLLVFIGLGLAYWGIAIFARRRTAIYPNRDASQLVIEGPYRFTRNPMYTGMTIAYLGGCGIVGTLWPLILLPFALAVLVRAVIAREERYLTDAFGDSYREYQRKVGRWF